MRTPVRRSGRSHGGALVAATCTFVLPVCVGAAAGPALAQQPSEISSRENLVSLEVREARLEEVVAILSRQTGLRNIVIENEPGQTFRPVSLNVSDLPLSRVLQAAARAAGGVVASEDGIFYIRPKTAANAAASSVDPAEAVLVPAPQPASPAPQRQDLAAPATPAPGVPRQWMKVVLQYLKPSQFTSLVKNPDFLTVDDGPLPQIKLSGTGPQITPSPPAVQILPASTGGENNSASPGGFAAGHRDAPGETAGQFGGGGGGFRGGGGGFQGGGGGFQGGPGGGGVGGQPGAGGQQGQGTLLPLGVDQVLAFDVDNSLLVRGTPEGLEELRSIIRLLDIPPKQVEIKAEFVEVRVNDRDDFGIEWDIRPAGNVALDLPSGTGVSQGSLFLRIASGNAVATLRADITRQTTNLLQSPIISTINNVPATIVVSQTVPYTTTSTVFNANQAITQTQVQFATATNGLQVQPRINGDNSITLFLQPQLQNVTLIPAGPGGQLLPQSSQSALTTYRRIQNGETMVLGGFITKQEVVSTNRTPILSDLPIIGSLFRSRSRNITGSEVLVFLTPRIIEERAQGTIGTGGATPAPSP